MKVIVLIAFSLTAIGSVLSLTGSSDDLKGPFLFWGNENLKQIKLAALEVIDEDSLSTIYSNSDVILIFLKKFSTKLNSKNFPCLSHLIEKSDSNWTYLPQSGLPLQPFDFSSNVETIYLDGDPLNDDRLVCEAFKDRTEVYGEGSVLGILSNFRDIQNDYKMKWKRDVKKEEEKPFVYKDEKENILFYTASPPVLTLYSEEDFNSEDVEISLRNPKHVWFEGNVEDKEDHLFNFTVFYEEKLSNRNITVKVPLKTSLGYWSFSSLEIGTDSFSSVLELAVGDIPSAPQGFSYWCARTLIFSDDYGNRLTINSIQIEPLFWRQNRSEARFSDAYDCVGFITVPILSGLFVSFLVLFVTLIGIFAIMEIKTPTRFDTGKTKQLTIILNDQDIRN